MTTWSWVVRWSSLLAVALVLAGCSVRFAPPEDAERDDRDDEPSEVEPVDEKTGEPDRDREPAERSRATGGAVPDAARGLLEAGLAALKNDEEGRALDLIQRAQRIAPDAAAIYYALGRVYREQDSLARAEQFVLKGISKAGNDPELSRQGWSALAGIRDSMGDQAGAETARERAGQR